MDQLKRKQVVREHKGQQRGTYIVNRPNMADFVEKRIDGDVLLKALKGLTESCATNIRDETETVLILAKLHVKLGTGAEGLEHIKKAAEILARSDEAGLAVGYYDYLLDYFSQNAPDRSDAHHFIDSALGKISLRKHLMPIEEQVSLLTRAQEVAKRAKMWDSLARIKFVLGQLFQKGGHLGDALKCMEDFRKISKRTGDQRMRKVAILLLAEFLYLYGRMSEIIRRYEEVVGDLEEFEDDEVTLRALANVGMSYVLSGRIARGMGMLHAVKVKADSQYITQASIFSDMATALSLLDLRQIDEAEVCVDRIFTLPEALTGPFVLRTADRCKAFVCAMRGDYTQAWNYLKRSIERSLYVGWKYMKGSWTFELLDTLEKHGFFHDEMNYDAEVEELLKWQDIHMKGVAYRYRALRAMEKQQPASAVMTDLKNSEKYLKRSGAEIELARTRLVLGKAYTERGDIKLAQSYLKKAWVLFSKLDKNLFPKDLVGIMPLTQRMELIVDRIISINESLGKVRERSAFLEQIINVAIDFSMAMRGAFFVMEKGEPKIIASRNLDPLFYKEEQFKLVRQVVAHVAADHLEAVIPVSKEEKADLPETALTKAGITSLICMPAKLGSRVHGYLYLDNRLGGAPFDNNLLPYVKLLCSQIGLGLANMEEYHDIKDLKDHYQQEATFYKREILITDPAKAIIGDSEGIRAVIEKINQVAPTDSSVLIMGETGVGKELVAKAIHNLSVRKDGAFIPVNLASLPDDLVTSELFGHEKGAFTGANEQHKGRLDLADGGTIFLDEVGDLPSHVQVKLLRVLQEGVFERLGSSKAVRSNFRVVAATNKDLLSEVESGVFRRDLYYRLNVFPIHVPPLRERPEDVVILANHFIDKFSNDMRKRIRRVPFEEMSKLTEYHWPGNVRELEHFIERAVILADGDTISFSGLLHPSGHAMSSHHHISMSLADVEREHIKRVLDATHWKVRGPHGAAALLGLKRSTLRARIVKLGIKRTFPFGP
jgi:transcriptional regulator with GAF, ATPase, and Fis domain